MGGVGGSGAMAGVQGAPAGPPVTVTVTEFFLKKKTWGSLLGQESWQSLPDTILDPLRQFGP